MPFTIQQVVETPTGPRSEIFPSSTYGIIEVPVLAGGATAITKQIGGVAIASTQWNLSPRSILSFGIHPSLAAGGDLQIDVSPDGTNYQALITFHLIGHIYNFLSGIELPGFCCRFILHNADAVAIQTFTGSIILKGV